MKINKFDNPIFLFLFCIFAIFINILSSIYFFPIFLLGTLFIAFFICVRKDYNYSLLLVLGTVFLIELNNGFKLFSVFILFFFIYLLLAPNVKRVLTFNKNNLYVYIVFFYIGLYILYSFNSGFTSDLNTVIFVNLIIDLIVFGVLI